ncbi:nuclear transport factor 2 family protein [Seonamhaeicola marinus]|uniref:Nuclear transport factor 2 family protein n=1 Tax=Seonamhaeicola marinus TaxID=1912246 RepID=A0A5D0HVQ5_9FLAO|nr:nuclear transport factor 2 family protein [Seonamhaeicola marinus]TYA74609.1 nuclear transport factor 2 family protein [Seonamhaeicola marinus]
MYQEHIKDIETTISNYFEGIFNGDVHKLNDCFHSSVVLFGDINGATYLKSKTDYLEGVKSRQSPKDLNETFKMKIIGLDIMGDIAMAKLHVPMLGYNYYDYLSLNKIDDKWVIVGKIFTHVA